MEQYHGLWKIELCFRIMKTTLEIRPIFHWTPDRIEGLFMLCFIAFLMQRTLELKLENNKVKLCPEKIRETLNSLQVSKISIRQQDFYLKGKHNKEASKILQKRRISPPKNITPIDELKLT